MSEGERRLAAIMYTDIVGYTSLTQKDESSTLQTLEKHRSLLRPHFSGHGGREIKTIGDAFLVEFNSALDAVLCAIAIQQMMHDRKVARGEQLSLRIGIHVGDVVESGSDILGDAVNIASRIYPLAEPGGICLTSQVYEQVSNKSDLPFVSLGEKTLKNVSMPVRVYSVQMSWERSPAASATAYPTNRIAILPFRNMSPDPNDEYFAEGMTEEIISTVSGIGGLGVISRTSVMRYKGSNKSIEEIGKELRVGSVLEGSLRKAGNKIRVTTQLINVADDQHLWAQNYDRSLDDVFEVQSDVAKQVADALRVRILSPEKERIEKRPTGSTRAYTIYLKGRLLWNKRDIEDLRKARELFEQAVREDSSFALAYAGQADACLLLRENFQDDIDENLRRAKAAVFKALELDPELAEAHATRGLLLHQEYDFDRADVEYTKAIELKPSYATAHQWYSGNLLVRLRWGAAREQIEKAVELDPLSPIIHHTYGEFLYYAREYDKALEEFRRSGELGSPYARGWMAYCDWRLKKYEDAMQEYSEALKAWQAPQAVPPEVDYEATVAYYKGDKDAVKRLLPEYEAHYQEPGGPAALQIAGICFYLGDIDKAFEWLERAIARKESAVTYIQLFTDLDGVRTDPRYLDLLKRLGLD